MRTFLWLPVVLAMLFPAGGFVSVEQDSGAKLVNGLQSAPQNGAAKLIGGFNTPDGDDPQPLGDQSDGAAKLIGGIACTGDDC